MRKLLCGFVLCAACGCRIYSQPIQSAYQWNDQQSDGTWVSRTVCVGMTCSQVVDMLGVPVWSARGHSCRLYHEFNGIWPGLWTSELAFQRGDDLLVVWAEAGEIIAVGVRVARPKDV